MVSFYKVSILLTYFFKLLHLDLSMILLRFKEEKIQFQKMTQTQSNEQREVLGILIYGKSKS